MTWLKVDKIEQAIADGCVTKRKHPEADLYILNYSRATQYDFHWEKDTTMVCRGLIVDGDWNVIARPFEKFFTLDQLTTLRNKVYHLYGLKFKNMFDGKFKAFDKMDGSLGILYPLGDKMFVATRGSFESEMAIKGSQMLADMGMADEKKWHWKEAHGEWSNMTDHATFLFEIIYPENRIVVDYKGEEKLVLIDVIWKDHGNRSPALFGAASSQFEAAKEYTHIKSMDDLDKEEYDGREGYVLVFDNGLRVKWKFEEYKRLHYILTGLNEKVIWEWCKDGKDVSAELADVPDEFHVWGTEVEEKLRIQYEAIYASVCFKLACVKGQSRKEIAIKYRDYSYRGILFAMMDNKNYEESIWRTVKQGMKENEEEFNSPSIFS